MTGAVARTRETPRIRFSTAAGSGNPPDREKTTTSALAPINFSRISRRYPESRPIATTSAATPRPMPAMESSETEDTSREGRDRRYRRAISRGRDIVKRRWAIGDRRWAESLHRSSRSSSFCFQRRAPSAQRPFAHRLDEPLEEHVRVVRPGCRLGMKLRREDRQGAVAETFERPIVQIAMCLFDLGRKLFALDGEPVILRGDRDLPGAQVAHGMVRPAVTELQLEGTCSEREPEQLVAQTDPENRPRADQLLQSPNRTREGGRIPGAVGQKDPVRFESENLFGRRGGWKDRDAATGAVQKADDVALHAVIDRADVEPSVLGLEDGRERGRDREREVAADHGRRLEDEPAQLFGFQNLGRQPGSHRPLSSDPPHQRASVQPMQPEHAR